jgi:hypothetical protein
VEQIRHEIETAKDGEYANQISFAQFSALPIADRLL